MRGDSNGWGNGSVPHRYSGLAVDREGSDIAAWLNGIGVSAYVLKYRVPARSWLPFGAAPLMDAQCVDLYVLFLFYFKF